MNGMHIIDRLLHSATVVLFVMLLQGCQPSAPSLGGAQPLANIPATGSAAALTDAKFDTLTLDDQYRVVNKLLATVYTGVPVEQFYSLDSAVALGKRIETAPTIASIREQLDTDLEVDRRLQYDQEITGDENAVNDMGYPDPIEPAFHFDRNKPKQMPLARMYHYPLSRNMFSQWMAWHLANTILFSPAEEIDSADITDVQNLYRRLDLAIMNRQSIRSIVATHQNSIQNWRRFRSPEDNTREMMEIYLGIFDNDEEVPLASQACQDLYLTDEADGYKLAYTDYPNSESVLVLDNYVVNCADFYRVISSHPLLIPRVVSVLVDYFYAGMEVDERLAITQAISSSNPTTFDDIFLTILFSESYLLDTERTRSFEESFLPMAKRLQWDAHPDVFKGMISGSGSLARTDMEGMGWPSMSLKLGRASVVPLDSHSFGNYHKAMREGLMMDSRRWRQDLGVEKPKAPNPQPLEPPAENATSKERASYQVKLDAYNQVLAQLSIEERADYDEQLSIYRRESSLNSKLEDFTVPQIIDYLFLSAVQRRAKEEELKALTDIFYANNHLDEELANSFVRVGRLDDVSLITMDYLSRLPELYFLPRIR